jgi:hypothetical protein
LTPYHNITTTTRTGTETIKYLGKELAGVVLMRRERSGWWVLYHLMSGFDSKVLTFMPKKPTVKVRGRKLEKCVSEGWMASQGLLGCGC